MARTPRILIIDDEPLMRISISDALGGEGYDVEEAELCARGTELIGRKGFDVVITDLRLPDGDGLEVLRHCKRFCPATMVIMITAHGSVDTAVEAMRLGAYNYVTKPFSMDELFMMVRRIIRMQDLEQENTLLKEQMEGKYNFGGIVGKSERIKGVFDRVKTVAQTDSTVLLLGESGTGKELIANAIHYNSARREKPFVKINCSALPETLLEAELFGYERGAFTGAVSRKKGRFELAEGGSIFLDEIGELSPQVQVKLLRVLQEKEFDRLGGTETLDADVRIICATQKDLKREAAEGVFREDLYYRLNVVPITLPPLRERKGDVMLLAGHFLSFYTGQYGKPEKRFSADAEEFLLNHPFPGNVRELENSVERAVVLSKGAEIQPWDLSEEVDGDLDDCFKVMRNLKGDPGLSKAIKEFEKHYIAKVLKEASGNKTLAAKLLGVSRKTLWEKCKGLDIPGDGGE